MILVRKNAFLLSEWNTLSLHFTSCRLWNDDVWFLCPIFLNNTIGKQLDCFGIAITVLSIVRSFLNHNDIAISQDVQLALSEDHAWLIYNNGNDSAEVTWNGNKENNNKRGESVDHGCKIDVTKCWLYSGKIYILLNLNT